LSEEEYESNKADADILLCMAYLKFLLKNRRKPQLIRVAPDVLSLLVPSAERKPITFFDSDVILDESLSGTCECQWKI